MQCKIPTVSTERKEGKRSAVAGCEIPITLLSGEGSIQLQMKEAAVLFYSPYRISGSDKLSQRGIHPLVPARQVRFTRFTESIATSLFSSSLICPQKWKKIQNLRREGLTEEAAIEAVLEGARAQDEVTPGIILVALR